MSARANQEIRPADERRLAPGEWLAVGVGSGLLGGLAMAAPLVIWDWVRSGHMALELPMAATAWLFGLQHFSHDSNLAWPIVIGAVLFVAYWALSGLVFTTLAEAMPGIRRPVASVAAGFVWGFVSFVFFWDMLLPIARDGAPFRAPASAALFVEPTFVAPNWVFILGFVLMGLVTGASYAALRGSPATREEARDEREPNRRPLHRAA
jgi:hypothetical protein